MESRGEGLKFFLHPNFFYAHIFFTITDFFYIQFFENFSIFLKTCFSFFWNFSIFSLKKCFSFFYHTVSYHPIRRYYTCFWARFVAVSPWFFPTETTGRKTNAPMQPTHGNVRLPSAQLKNKHCFETQFHRRMPARAQPVRDRLIRFVRFLY